MRNVKERVEAEARVLEANHRFYRAFAAGDFDAMSRLWAERAPSACLHPGAPLLVGRAAVLASWRQILAESGGVDMVCRTPRVFLLGDSAFVTCLEANGQGPAHLVATNVFVLEDGAWRMVHHQAGPLSRAVPAAHSDPTLN